MGEGVRALGEGATSVPEIGVPGTGVSGIGVSGAAVSETGVRNEIVAIGGNGAADVPRIS
jgi:hypothetical protein